VIGEHRNFDYVLETYRLEKMSNESHASKTKLLDRWTTSNGTVIAFERKVRAESRKQQFTTTMSEIPLLAQHIEKYNATR
jgi:hypothetical protein